MYNMTRFSKIRCKYSYKIFFASIGLISLQSIERVEMETEKVVKSATAVSRSQLLLVFFQVYKIFNFRSLLNNHNSVFSFRRAYETAQYK